jgi:DNA primase
VFFSEPIDVRIATLSSQTDAKDPDELLKREGGRAVLDRVIEKATDPLDVLFNRIRVRVSEQGLSGRSRIVGEFLDQLTGLGLHRVDTIRQQLIIKRLAQITGVEWGAITGEIAARRVRRRSRETDNQTTPIVATPLTSREHLLGCVMCDPSLQHSLNEEQSLLLDPEAYAHGPMQEVARAIASLVVDEQPPTLESVLGMLDEPETQRCAIRLAREVERLTEGDSDRLHRHWRDRIRDAVLEDARAGNSAVAAPDIAGGADETSGAADSLQRLTQLRDLRKRLGTDARAVPRAGPV